MTVWVAPFVDSQLAIGADSAALHARRFESGAGYGAIQRVVVVTQVVGPSHDPRERSELLIRVRQRSHNELARARQDTQQQCRLNAVAPTRLPRQKE